MDGAARGASDCLVGYTSARKVVQCASAHLRKLLLVRHDDVVLESDNDVLIRSEFEVVRNHPRIVLLLVSNLKWRAAKLTLIW